jgi:hypothetical protein
VNRCTLAAPSMPAYRSWLSSEIARAFGLLPAGWEELMVAVVRSRTAIVLGLVAAVPVTER